MILQFAKHFAGYLQQQNLKHLIVHVTNNCNFRCDHCFIDFSPKRDLKLEQYQALARQIGPLFWLDIAGGEPFLRKDLAEIIAAFDTQVVQIPTNGSLEEKTLDQLERMKKLTDTQITVSLSLDGLQEQHDRIRHTPGSWDKVWQTFEKIRQIGGISIKINTVLNQDNADEIIEMMEEVRRRGPDFHSIILLRGDPINPEFGLPPLDKLHELGGKIFSILETYDYGRSPVMAHLLRNYHKFLWNTSLGTIEKKTQVIPCLAGRAHMVVWGDGRVSSCEMLDPIGDIRDRSWEEILASPAYKQQVQDIKDKKCYCTHNCAMFDSILLNPKNLPNLLVQSV
ncbi:MAG: radical SAM protein [Cyanobacteria bacterium P01_E01_bin.42]